MAPDPLFLFKGDKEAAKMFVGESCGLSQRPGWTCEKKNIP
jgi:hypothetical protein